MKNFDKIARDKWDKREPRTRGGKYRAFDDDDSPKKEARIRQNQRNEAIKREGIEAGELKRQQRRLEVDEAVAQKEREKAGLVFGDWS